MSFVTSSAKGFCASILEQMQNAIMAAHRAFIYLKLEDKQIKSTGIPFC
jgi:hypothetical protein